MIVISLLRGMDEDSSISFDLRRNFGQSIGALRASNVAETTCVGRWHYPIERRSSTSQTSPSSLLSSTLNPEQKSSKPVSLSFITLQAFLLMVWLCRHG